MKLGKTVIFVVLSIVIGIIFRQPKNGTTSKGFVKPGYEQIRRIFDSSVINCSSILKYEKEGLAVAVYRNNELVADLWGGYAERDAFRLWEKDTLSIGFSTTKTIGAFTIAILASRKQLNYNDKVIKYWPEFGKYDKENVTIQWLVEHKAGLIKFDGDMNVTQANDHQYVSHLIENTKPMWPPGTEIGYHALTYGWLIDQIVRRTDPKKRSLAEFYMQEIRPLAKDKDYFIGLPKSEQYRMARIVQATWPEYIKGIIKNPFFIRFAFKNVMENYDITDYKGLMNIAANYPPFMTVLKREMPYNDPKVQQVQNCAVSGYGTARGLGAVISAILQSNLISPEIWKQLSKPTALVTDRVARLHSYRGHGFFYELHPTRDGEYLMMHTGHGRQKVIIDLHTKVGL
uniref:Beta-lactamase domain-containing protein n=1 Tax=Syphacia muris TaxID=451379 RepID=A0A0N5AN72_9BILA